MLTHKTIPACIDKTFQSFQCTTHLGNLLTPGDVVLGYDLVSSILPGADEWSLKKSFNSSFVLPDVVHFSSNGTIEMSCSHIQP